MASFTQWTTEDLKIILEDDEGNPVEGVLDDVKNLVVTITQGSVVENWFLEDIGLDQANSTINLPISQERSGRFEGDKTAKVQVNILYNDSERDATAKGKIDVFDNLYDKEME